MKQKYEVIAPGTVIISAGGNCTDIRKVVEPVLQKTVVLFIILIYRKMNTNWVVLRLHKR
jgi:hypothetical protein